MKSIYIATRSMARRALLPLLYPKRFDACCCGLSKTGTHSITGIFADYRCKHHPDADTRLPLVMAYLKGEKTLASTVDIIRKQDRWLWLEMESSALAGILIKAMVEACPTKKYILTIRDVYSWVDSWFDHNINSPPDKFSAWQSLDHVRLRIDEFVPNKYDSHLVEKGFAPLACYFQLWQHHNSEVIESVPDERLLIVKTRNIIEMIPVMADWLGVPADTLQSERGWLFAASEKHGTLAKLDPGYVRETAFEYCGDLMQRFFPETTLNSAILSRHSES